MRSGDYKTEFDNRTGYRVGNNIPWGDPQWAGEKLLKILPPVAVIKNELKEKVLDPPEDLPHQSPSVDPVASVGYLPLSLFVACLDATAAVSTDDRGGCTGHTDLYQTCSHFRRELICRVVGIGSLPSVFIAGHERCGDKWRFDQNTDGGQWAYNVGASCRLRRDKGWHRSPRAMGIRVLIVRDVGLFGISDRALCVPLASLTMWR